MIQDFRLPNFSRFSKRAPCRFGYSTFGLVFLTFLLLVSDGVWAQMAIPFKDGGCGTHSVDDRDHTCGDEGSDDFAGGINYFSFYGGLTLRIPGVSGSSTSIGTLNDRDGGRFSFSQVQDSAISITEADSITLTIGTTGPVEITQDAPSLFYRSPPRQAQGNGIYIYQIGVETTGAVTVDVKSGVTIGTQTARMLNNGIFVGAYSTASTATHSVTSGATIYATNHGIDLRTTGKGKASIMNTGDITAGKYGISLRLESALNTGGGELTNSGTIMSGSDGSRNSHGIYLSRSSLGYDVTIPVPDDPDEPYDPSVNLGRVEAVTIRNTGVITAKGAFSDGIHFESLEIPSIRIRPGDYTGGDVTITNEGDITASRFGIYLDGSVPGAITITNTGGTVLGETESGILARNMEGDAGDVTVSVTGGTVRSTGDSTSAIHARNRGTGNVIVDVTGGRIVSKNNAGIFASLGDAPDNQVKVTQGGTISGRTGVYAQVAVSTTAETVTPRAAAAQPLIDIDWSGRFAAGTADETAPNDEARFAPTSMENAVALVQEVESEQIIRYGSAAGIEAQVMSWRDVMRTVAKGDDQEIADNAKQMELLSETHSNSRRAAIIESFREVLENDDLGTIPGADAIDTDGTPGLSDAEIADYLGEDDAYTRRLLRTVLARSFSDAEEEVLRAVVTGDTAGLTALLNNEDAGFSEDYKTAVQALLNRYNVGNIDIDVNGGSINSRGDGIRAYYATPHANNGAIAVTVAEGAEVTGAKAGIYVANAGMGEGNVLKQTVTVNGMVTGGEGAGVHMAGGGTVTVGETGRVVAGEGDAIRSEAGDLSVSVAGAVEGDIRSMGGTLTFASMAGSQVTGTVYDPGPLTAVAGSVGRLFYTNGGTVTVAQTGLLTGVDGETAAIQSDAGDLDVTVAGTVAGDIRGMGDGEHVVDVQRGGTVTGTIHLDGSTVTVGGTVGRINLENMGSVVTVAQTGRVTGIPNGDYGVKVGADGTVTNRGTIAGTIGIQAGAGSTVVNSGTVRSTEGSEGIAIDFPDGGGNTVTLQRGSTINGDIRVYDQSDRVNASDLQADDLLLRIVDQEGNPLKNVTLPTQSAGCRREGATTLCLNTTAFALTDEVLSDLTGNIHAAVIGNGLSAHAREGDPARGRVWAAPFGGARDQNGVGGLTDGTHYFGGGMLGAGWGTDMRIGVFVGGSTGQLDVDNVQTIDMQTVFGGAYAQRAWGDLLLDARFLMGSMDHDSTRRMGPNSAGVKYTSIFLSPEIGIATNMQLMSRLWATPRLRVRYAGLFTEGFRERGRDVQGQYTGWDLRYPKRDVQILEARGQVGIPIALENGGRIEPRVGLEGRYLVAGDTVDASLPTDGAFTRDAGGDRGVATGSLGLGMSVPVADATSLVGNFDGAFTTDHAWRATGYLGLVYSF